MARRSRGAFTLIELLIVIAIIALLIAILLPSLAGARKAAHSIVCASQLRQLGTGLSLYADDNKDRYPTRGGIPDFGGIAHWAHHLTTGYAMDSVLVCPADFEPVGGFDGDIDTDFGPRSYFINGFNDHFFVQTDDMNIHNYIGMAMNRADIFFPSDTAVFAEKDSESRHFYLDILEGLGNDFTEIEPSRHGPLISNYAFADTSVRSLKYPEPISPTNIFATTKWGRSLTGQP